MLKSNASDPLIIAMFGVILKLFCKLYVLVVILNYYSRRSLTLILEKGRLV